MCDPSGTRIFRCHPTNLPPVVEDTPWNEERYWCPLRLASAAARSSGMWDDSYQRHDFDLHWVLLPNSFLKSGGLFFLERQFELDW